MDKTTDQNGIFRLLGAVFFIQALMPLISGMVFNALESKEDIEITMINVANSMARFHGTILVWILTAVFIVVLGAVIYRTAGHVNKTMAMIALCLYLFEAVLVVVGQTFVFGLGKASQLYVASSDAGLLNLGNVLLTCRHFAGQIAMIPFGLGAILFYYLLMKAGVIPKWLALWGLVTAPLILVGIPLTTFGVNVPFAFFVPYVPFEFFTGIYILIKYRKRAVKQI